MAWCCILQRGGDDWNILLYVMAGMYFLGTLCRPFIDPCTPLTALEEPSVVNPAEGPGIPAGAAPTARAQDLDRWGIDRAESLGEVFPRGCRDCSWRPRASTKTAAQPVIPESASAAGRPNGKPLFPLALLSGGILG